MGLTIPRHRKEYEWRIERQRHDRVSRHAPSFIFNAGACNGHARGKLSHNPPLKIGIERHVIESTVLRLGGLLLTLSRRTYPFLDVGFQDTKGCFVPLQREL